MTDEQITRTLCELREALVTAIKAICQGDGDWDRAELFALLIEFETCSRTIREQLTGQEYGVNLESAVKIVRDSLMVRDGKAINMHLADERARNVVQAFSGLLVGP